jgi:hypothetical protein
MRDGDEPAHEVRRDEPDERDEPGLRDRRAGRERHHRHEREAPARHADPEARGRPLAEHERVEHTSGARGRRQRDGPGQREPADPVPADEAGAAEQECLAPAHRLG